MLEGGGAVQQVPRDAADVHDPPPKVLHLFFGFAICSMSLGASICVPSVLKVRRRSRFEVFSSSCLPVCSLVCLGATTNRRSFLVLTHG